MEITNKFTDHQKDVLKMIEAYKKDFLERATVGDEKNMKFAGQYFQEMGYDYTIIDHCYFLIEQGGLTPESKQDVIDVLSILQEDSNIQDAIIIETIEPINPEQN